MINVNIHPETGVDASGLATGEDCPVRDVSTDTAGTAESDVFGSVEKVARFVAQRCGVVHEELL